MASIITIFGTLTSEPRLKTVKDSFSQVLRFSIVSESSSKKLTYFEVLSYDTSLVTRLKKGSLIQLTGEFELADSQTDEEGRLYTSLRVVADRIFILKSEQPEDNSSNFTNFNNSNDAHEEASTSEAKPEAPVEKPSYAPSYSAPVKRRGRPKRK